MGQARQTQMAVGVGVAMPREVLAARQDAAFGQAVRTRERPETDGWSGVQALAVIEAMQESITNEAWATVPDARLSITES